jgi:hypothetical protein
MACLHGLVWPLTITLRTAFTTSHQETLMPDVDTTALIEHLQKSNRRWKRLALSLLAALGLALVLLTTSTVVLWVRAERQARQVEAAERQARQQAEEARKQFQEAAYQRALMQAVDEFQHQGRHP